jgi:hypothetical protein
MAEKENDKRVDDLLDSLLSEYSAAEPRPGLEMRIRAGLKTHARQRRRQWALVFAASAALVILAALIARTRRPQETAPSRVAVQKTSPKPAPRSRNAVEPAPHRAGSTTTHERRARLRKRPDSRILLQANAMLQAENMIFAHEKLYLSAPPQPEQQPGAEERTSAPDISIQHLGVRPIEIKDLTSAKDMN